MSSDTNAGSNNEKGNYREQHEHNIKKNKPFIDFLKEIGRFCLKVIRKGNINSFEILKGGEIKATFPITVLALLSIFAFWVTIPLIIIGLFFGFRYRFVGPDFTGNGINEAMNSAADAAENLKNSIK